MLETLRRVAPIPAVQMEGVVGAATVGAFVWLLVEGYIRPLAVYFLELYLSF
jgi:hypothetical protein